MNRAPGPRRLALLRFVRATRRDTLAAMTDLMETYGDVVRLKFPVSPIDEKEIHVLRHPRDARRVLQENHTSYGKSSAYEKILSRLAGRGLITSDGPLWKRQRRLAQPAFHRRSVERFAVSMTAATADLAARWDGLAPGTELNIADEMRALALDIVGRTLFSSALGPLHHDIDSGLTDALHYFDRAFDSLVVTPLWVPSRRNRRMRDAVARLERVVYGLINARAEREAEFDDLLSMMLLARDDETGERMSRTQVRDEVMTFLLAGHETSANALAWCWHLLAGSPAARERLEREADSILAGRAATVEDLPRMPYARMVIEEAMRLYPPAWVVERRALGADVLGGYDVPAGSAVMASTYLTHRNPSVWPEPDHFDPERFAPEAAAERPLFAYFPFGGGPRQCIGNLFAMVETQLVLSTLAGRFRLEGVPGARVSTEASVTLRPVGLRMTLQRRQRVVSAGVPAADRAR